MAATQPSTAPAAPAVGAEARPGDAAGTLPGLALLVALLAACAYAAFGHGATRFPEEPRLQVALAALGLAAAALWAGDRGIGARAPRIAVWGLALLVGFAAWSGLTLLWSVAPDRTWLEVNRALAYALVVALGLAAGTSCAKAIERTAVGYLVIAVAVGLYALGGKVAPDFHINGLIDLNHTATVARLRAPLEYWNALALVLAMGVPIAIRIVVDPVRGIRARLAALAAVYLLIIDMGMTYSRGGVLALVTATAVITIAGGARLRGLAALALAGVAAALPLAVAFSKDGLTQNAATLAHRVADGRVLLGSIGFCLGGLMVAGWYLHRIEPRVRWSPARSRLVWRALAAVAATAALGGIGYLTFSDRGLTGSVSHFAHSFTDVKQDKQFDPVRLTSTNSGNRWVWWQEAVGAWSDKPFGGWGAGSFPVTHLQYRKNTLPVAQPHSVPLQFLAETGIVGALLALGGIGLLIAAAILRIRAMGASRERELAVALLAGVAAWVVHGAYDWDWDIPGVTIPAMLFLGVLVAIPTRAGERDGRPVIFVDPETGARGTSSRAIAVAGATLVACAFAFSAILPSWSDSKASAAQDLVGGDTVTDQQLQDAAAEAHLAAKLDPLSVEPLQVSSAIATRRGRLLEARQDLLDAVDRQPTNAAAWEQLGQVAYLLADRKGFEEAALRALSLDPQNVAYRKIALRAVAAATPPGASATATGTPLSPGPATTTGTPSPPVGSVPVTPGATPPGAAPGATPGAATTTATP